MPVDTILYDRLEVSPNASDTDIKKAYRKLSMKYHPDRNQDDVEGATKKFQSIQEAHAILSDKEKRKTYDMVGIEMLKHGGEGPPMNPNDIFSQFMGGMGGFNPFGGSQRRSKPAEEPCIVEKVVTLEDVYNERTISIKYTQHIFCQDCDGNGTKDKKTATCSKCNGNGQQVKTIRQGPMIQQVVMSCDTCKGTGEYVDNSNKCTTCKGVKYSMKEKSIDVPLKQGLTGGNKIQLSKKGHHYKNIKTDLIVIINIKPHSIFQRDDNDLHININIKLYQDLFGFNKVIKHLDGRELNITCKNPVNSNAVMMIKGEGMKDLRDKRGNLIVHINTLFPNLGSLSKEESLQLKTILSKLDMDDFRTEIDVLKNIKNYKTVVLEPYVERHNSRQNRYHQDNDGPPECVQQ